MSSSSQTDATDEENITNGCFSSQLQIVIDDQPMYDSINDGFKSRKSRHQKISSTGNGRMTYRRQRQLALKNPKPHRLIEKRRRDRMNGSLNNLLELIPHKKPESQRRIEKTEIIEMAIQYIQSLISSNQKSSQSFHIKKQLTGKLDGYRFGYHNSICDIYEYLEKQFNNDRLLTGLIQFSEEKELELKDLLAVPEKQVHIETTKKSSHASCDISHSDDTLCAIANVRSTKDHDNMFQFSIDEELDITEQTKVPIFVLHPSGTYYVPMSINSSIVSHAFNHKSKATQSSSLNDTSLQCHPVSIPVNFNPISALSDTYELDIQNINVVGTRHQTSVKPT